MKTEINQTKSRLLTLNDKHSSHLQIKLLQYFEVEKKCLYFYAYGFQSFNTDRFYLKKTKQKNNSMFQYEHGTKSLV